MHRRAYLTSHLPFPSIFHLQQAAQYPLPLKIYSALLGGRQPGTAMLDILFSQLVYNKVSMQQSKQILYTTNSNQFYLQQILTNLLLYHLHILSGSSTCQMKEVDPPPSERNGSKGTSATSKVRLTLIVFVNCLNAMQYYYLAFIACYFLWKKPKNVRTNALYFMNNVFLWEQPWYRLTNLFTLLSKYTGCCQ